VGLRRQCQCHIQKSISERVSASHLEADGEDIFKSEELIQLDSDPWIKYLNTL